MTELISKIVGRWRGADGVIAEVTHEGQGDDDPKKWNAVDSLPSPVVHLNTALHLTSKRNIILPTTEIAHLLSDRSGVLIVFDPNNFKSAFISQFRAPDNAAIFNADGSLRFQLQNPCGEIGIFRAVLRNQRPDGVVELGVRACPRDWPVCESVYIVDGSTPEIGKQLPRWVRD